jgi:methionyl-tRNA synthetase
METILYVTAETLRRLAIPLQAFIPASAGALLDLLGVAGDARDFAHSGEANALAEGAALPPPAPIFPRYVEETEQP